MEKTRNTNGAMITAIKFLEKQAFASSTITEVEIEIVDKVENYIDSLIKAQYDSFSTSVDIQDIYVQFRYDGKERRAFSYSTTQRVRMQKELMKRYTDAGWDITYRTDGENSSHEVSYYVFNAKKR